MHSKTLIPLSVAIAAISACKPIEYAEELAQTNIEIRSTAPITGTQRLDLYIDSEAEAVLSGVVKEPTLTDFRGPPGWYHGVITGDFDGDGANDRLNTIFKYSQESTKYVNFNALSSFAYTLSMCKNSDYDKAISVLNSSFAIDPVYDGTDESAIEKQDAIDSALTEYAATFNASFNELLFVMQTDMEDDCLLNGFTADRETGARTQLAYFDTIQTDESLSSGLSQSIYDYGVSHSIDLSSVSTAIARASNLFNNNVTQIDSTATVTSPISDLGVSIFSNYDLSFSYVENSGLRLASATINGVDQTVSINLADKELSITGDVSAFSSGSYPLIVSTTDLAGNENDQTFTIIIDNTGPSASFINQYTNTATTTVQLNVVPPTGEVISVAIGGVEFSNTTGDIWEGPVDAVVGSNAIDVVATTDFGKTVTRTLTYYYDNQSITYSIIPSSVEAISTAGATPVTTSPDLLNTSNQAFDLGSNENYMLGFNNDPTVMDAENIAYFSVGFTDPVSIGSTSTNDIDVTYTLSKGSIIVKTDSLPMESINGIDAIFTLPITYDFLTSDFTEAASGDIFDLNIAATDLSGNITDVDFQFAVYNDLRIHLLEPFIDLSGSVTPSVWKDGLTTEINSIALDCAAAECELPVNSQYDHFVFDLTDASYYNPETGLSVQALTGTETPVMTIAAADQTLGFDLGISTFAAMTSSGFFDAASAADSYTNGKASFENQFPGALTAEPFEFVSDIALGGDQDRNLATIFRNGLINAAQAYTEDGVTNCTAWELDYLISGDYADDLAANGSSNPATSICSGVTSTEANRALAIHEREIAYQQGLLVEGNAYDLTVGRSHFTPAAPVLENALSVGTYSGVISFTPVYTTDSISYNVDVFVNNIFHGSYGAGEEITINTADFPSGTTVVRFENTDLYYAMTTNTLFATFSN